jgi:hypothetical protein
MAKFRKLYLHPILAVLICCCFPLKSTAQIGVITTGPDLTPIEEADFIGRVADLVNLSEVDSTQIAPPCYDRDSCIDPLTGNSNWTTWNLDTAIVIHPLFPDCPILLDYRFRRCIGSDNKYQHYIDRFVIPDSADARCNALLSFLEAGNNDQAASAVGVELLHDIYAIIARDRFIDFNQQSMEDTTYPDTLYCDSPYLTYRGAYYTGTCMGACRAYIQNPNYSNSGVLTTFHACFEESCCRVENRFCVDRQSGTLVHNSNTDGSDSPVHCHDYPFENINDCYSAIGETFIYDMRMLPCRPSCIINQANWGGTQIIE